MVLLLAALVLRFHQTADYTKDLDALLLGLKESGAYVVADGVDFGRMEAAYRPRFVGAQSKRDLLTVLEAFVGELHDFHASLGTNNEASPRLVPSGTDLYGSWKGEQAYVEQVRQGSLAEEAGILPGDEILEVGEKAIRVAAGSWFGVLPPGERGWSWALNSALAGRWNVPRKLLLRRNRANRSVTLGTARTMHAKTRLTVQNRPGGILYVRPEDSLGQDDLLKEFDEALPELRAARGIVLDLRNTPSGGTTTVARGIMGLFIDKRLPYQRHKVDERGTGTVRDWVEYATPRLAKPVRGKLVVLVSRWTGSMGEGLAIGFDAMKRATVVGTRMAGLRGAVDAVELPVSGYRVYFPVEQVFHVNGTARHEWVPPVRVTPGAGDLWLEAAERVFGG